MRENIKWRFSWFRNENGGGEGRGRGRGRGDPFQSETNKKGREKERLKRTVCTLQRYKCNAPFLHSPIVLLLYDLPLRDTAVHSSGFIIFFMLEKYF